MSITYKNSADQITVGQAIKLHETGTVIVINDGKDVTFEIETISTSKESTRRN